MAVAIELVGMTASVNRVVEEVTTKVKTDNLVEVSPGFFTAKPYVVLLVVTPSLFLHVSTLVKLSPTSQMAFLFFF